jgi:hypothetical protein
VQSIMQESTHDVGCGPSWPQPSAIAFLERSTSNIFSDVRSASKSRRRHLDRLHKYDSFKHVNPGQLNAAHYSVDAYNRSLAAESGTGNLPRWAWCRYPFPASLEECPSETMTKRMFWKEAREARPWRWSGKKHKERSRAQCCCCTLKNTVTPKAGKRKRAGRHAGSEKQQLEDDARWIWWTEYDGVLEDEWWYENEWGLDLEEPFNNDEEDVEEIDEALYSDEMSGVESDCNPYGWEDCEWDVVGSCSPLSVASYAMVDYEEDGFELL